MQVVDIARNDHTLRVLPGAAPDAITRVHATRTARAQVSAPRAVTRAGGLRERLTMAVCTGKPAEIRAFAAADAGYEECHRILGCSLLHISTPGEAQRSQCDRGQSKFSFHDVSSVVVRCEA